MSWHLPNHWKGLWNIFQLQTHRIQRKIKSKLLGRSSVPLHCIKLKNLWEKISKCILFQKNSNWMYQPWWFSTFSCEFLWLSFKASVAETLHTNTKWYFQKGKRFQITSQVFLVRKSNVEAIDYAWILVFFLENYNSLKKSDTDNFPFWLMTLADVAGKSPLKNKYVKEKLVYSISFANNKNWNRTICWCQRRCAIVFLVYSKIGW